MARSGKSCLESVEAPTPAAELYDSRGLLLSLSQSAASICFEIWGVVDPGKICWFSRKIYEKFRFFQAILKKTRFSRNISQKFRFCFRQFHKKSTFLSKFAKNFDFFSGNFMQNFDFSWQISEKYRFPKQKLAIYSYFWANYSISLQKSPLSNILPLHDKI